MWIFLARHWKPLAGIALVIAMIIAFTVWKKGYYNAAFNRGYEVAREEAKTALDMANLANRTSEKVNDKTIVEYQTVIRERNEQREATEQVIADKLVPMIEATNECKIDPAVIAGINEVRKQ